MTSPELVSSRKIEVIDFNRSQEHITWTMNMVPVLRNTTGFMHICQYNSILFSILTVFYDLPKAYSFFLFNMWFWKVTYAASICLRSNWISVDEWWLAVSSAVHKSSWGKCSELWVTGQFYLAPTRMLHPIMLPPDITKVILTSTHFHQQTNILPSSLVML